MPSVQPCPMLLGTIEPKMVQSMVAGGFCPPINPTFPEPLRNAMDITVAGDVYTKLPSYEEATAKLYDLPIERMREVLEGFRVIILKHNLQDEVGISLEHHHFPLAQDEILVETQFIDVKESRMNPVKLADLDPASPPIPFHFALRDHKLCPYEYVLDSGIAAWRLKKVMDNEQFQQQIVAAIEASGMDDILGIHILHRDHMHGAPRGIVETPGSSDRQLLLRPYTDELHAELPQGDGVKQVLWSFGNTKECGLCLLFCFGQQHCGAHKK